MPTSLSIPTCSHPSPLQGIRKLAQSSISRRLHRLSNKLTHRRVCRTLPLNRPSKQLRRTSLQHRHQHPQVRRLVQVVYRKSVAFPKSFRVAESHANRLQDRFRGHSLQISPSRAQQRSHAPRSTPSARWSRLLALLNPFRSCKDSVRSPTDQPLQPSARSPTSPVRASSSSSPRARIPRSLTRAARAFGASPPLQALRSFLRLMPRYQTTSSGTSMTISSTMSSLRAAPSGGCHRGYKTPHSRHSTRRRRVYRSSLEPRRRHQSTSAGLAYSQLCTPLSRPPPRWPCRMLLMTTVTESSALSTPLAG